MEKSRTHEFFFVHFRDELKRHYTLGEYWIEVEMEDLASFDEDLSDCLYKLPSENLPLVITVMNLGFISLKREKTN